MKSKLITSVILFFSTSIQSEEWYAMSRHGECIALKQIAERLSGLKGSRTLDEIESKLKVNKVDYTLEPISGENRNILKLNIPEEEISMIIVPVEFCK